MAGGVTVPPATGSLKTTTSAALTGTSVFLRGGSVLTTTGGRVGRTVTPSSWSVTPCASATTTSMESPTRAPTGTGSSPPSRIVVTINSVPPTRWMVANLPAGTVPGVSDTYATLSPAPLARAGAMPASAATPAAGTGSETTKPSGGGTTTFPRPPGPSEQPPSHPSVVSSARAIPACTNLITSRFTACVPQTRGTDGLRSAAQRVHRPLTSVKPAQKNGWAVPASCSAARCARASASDSDRPAASAA